MRRSKYVTAVGVLLVLLGTGSCAPNLVANLIEERAGDISVIFINNTPYRVVFTYGTYDPLDRITPGEVNMAQERIEAHLTSGPNTIPCARAFAIGTEEFIARANATDAPAAIQEFDSGAFTPDIIFSSAPPDDVAATMPTAGKIAGGYEVLLGVDYACGDRLIFVFEEDEAAPGTFRVEFALLQTEED